MLRTAGTVVAMIAVFAACEGSAPVSGPADQAPDRPTASIGVVDPSVPAIQAVVDAMNAAWAAKSAAGYVASFSEDVEFINPIGGIVSGRAAIQAQHVFLFGGLFAGSTQTLTVRRVDFLTGTIAVVDLDAVLTGYVALPPGLRPTEPGVVRTRVRWVMEKRGGVWEIVAQQLTGIAPAP